MFSRTLRHRSDDLSIARLIALWVMVAGVCVFVANVFAAAVS